MTRIESNSRARGLTVGLVATIAGAFLLAALPAHAQRVSLNSLAGDHDAILLTQDHGVLPISACGTIDTPGSYIVTQNLDAAGTCLLVTADHVTIDLNGFVLSGDGTGRGLDTDGTLPNPRLDIAVRNGTVTGFSAGVFFRRVTGAVVEDLRAVDNGATFFSDGIHVGPGSTVTGNTASGNGDSGIFAFNGSTVTGNTASGNGGFGILAGDGSTVTGNTASGNGPFGSGIQAGVGSTVTGNTAIDNDNIGINAANGSTVTGNTAFNNAAAGVRVFCPSNVIGNTATNNFVNLVLILAGCNVANNVAP